MAFPTAGFPSREKGPRSRLGPCCLALALVLSAATACGSAGPSGPDGDGRVAVSASRLSFEPHETEEVVELENRGVVAVRWSVDVSDEWLLVSPASGMLPPGRQAVTVRVLRQLLALGTHAGRVDFVIDGILFPVQVTAVNVGVALARIEPESLRFGPDDSTATLTLSNHGEAPLTWSLGGPAWVEIEPAGGSISPDSAGDIVLTVHRGGLQDGTKTATLTLSSNGGEPTVNLEVEVASPAKLALSPASVDLRTSFTSQTVGVMNTGGRPLTWSTSGGAPWVTLSRTSGTVAPHKLSPLVVTVSRAGLSEGIHETRFTLRSNGGTKDLLVRLEVRSS